ncbi:MAG: hypothetical protein M3300_02960 [Actinomycetota bacterium]|nr:hypothetical protein [Actinomycetota bacterium]
MDRGGGRCDRRPGTSDHASRGPRTSAGAGPPIYRSGPGHPGPMDRGDWEHRPS